MININKQSEKTVDEKIVDLFVNNLLEMKHVSTITELDNMFYQLLLFLDPQGFLYNSSNNIHYMTNLSSNDFFPKKIVRCCNVYDKNNCINVNREKCDSQWYDLLKEKFKPILFNFALKGESVKTCYITSHKCPEIFTEIVNKLEQLGYTDEKYNQMLNNIKEFADLKIKMETMETDVKTLNKKALNLMSEINKVNNIIQNFEKDLHSELTDVSDKIRNLRAIKLRYEELTILLSDNNVRQITNAKIFIDAVKKSSTKILFTNA